MTTALVKDALAQANQTFVRWQFTAAVRLAFYRKLHTLIANRMPLALALETIEHIASLDGTKPMRPEALAAAAWREKIAEGAAIAEAAEGWAPERDILILQSAEFYGLENPLAHLIKLNDAMQRIRSGFLAALLYPAVILLTALTALAAASIYVVPVFVSIAPDIVWSGMAFYFAALSGHIHRFGLWWASGFVSALIAFSVSLPLWTGTLRRRMDKIPPWSIYRLWAGASWLLAFSSFIKAGIAEPAALAHLEKRATPWLRERNKAIRERVANGQELGQALMQSGYDFPDFEANLLISVYSGLSSSGEGLQKTAEEWINHGEKKLALAAAVLRTGALALAATIIIASVLSIYDMEQQITAALGI